MKFTYCPTCVEGGGTHAGLPDVTSDQHHAELHAANHADGGTDELDLLGLGSGAAGTGLIPVSDGAGGIAATPVNNNQGTIATLSGNLIIPVSTATDVAWDDELVDDGGWHDPVTNNDRITVPEAGWYQVAACARWGGIVIGDRVRMVIKINGAVTQPAYEVNDSAGINTPVYNIGGPIKLAANDYISLQVFHDGSVSVSLTAHQNTVLSVVRLW